jgi:hypothetical protein
MSTDIFEYSHLRLQVVCYIARFEHLQLFAQRQQLYLNLLYTHNQNYLQHLSIDGLLILRSELLQEQFQLKVNHIQPDVNLIDVDLIYLEFLTIQSLA